MFSCYIFVIPCRYDLNFYILAAKQTLENFIAELKEMIADPEKLHGNKLSKEEKVRTINKI